MSRKKQRILSLVLTAIVIALLLAIYFTIRDTEEEPAREPDALVIPFRREREEVARITFYSGGVLTYITPIVSDTGITWEYSAGEGFNLDPFRLSLKANLAWLFPQVRIAHECTEGLDLADFGLAPPILTVVAEYHDNTSHTIKIGEQTGDRAHYFLMLDDDPTMYLLQEHFVGWAKLSVADMLAMALPALDIPEAVYIRVAERGSAPMVLVADEYGAPEPIPGIQQMGIEQLFMQEPLAGSDISHSRLMELVLAPMMHLAMREVAEVMPDNLAPFGLDAPRLEFVLHTPWEEIHWKFGDTFTRDGMEMIYFMDTARPHVFITDFSPVESLFGLQALDIAERAFALVPIIDVERLTAVFPQGAFEIIFNHKPETFDINPTVNGYEAENRAVRTVFRHIISLRTDGEIEGFIPPATPEIMFTHHRIDNPDTVIRLYNLNVNFLAVSVDGGEVEFAVNRRVTERILAMFEALLPIEH